jgi:fluoroacetyl-CoA thioesterase
MFVESQFQEPFSHQVSPMDLTEKLTVGLTGTATTTVTRELTVAHFHADMPEVYGTPFMIYLMEVAASNVIQEHLPPGYVSVGAEVNVRHLAPTPVGRFVTATAVLQSVNGRLVTFTVEAHDGVAQIGSGTHVRGIVDRARFDAKLRSM